MPGGFGGGGAVVKLQGGSFAGITNAAFADIDFRNYAGNDQFFAYRLHIKKLIGGGGAVVNHTGYRLLSAAAVVAAIATQFVLDKNNGSPFDGGSLIFDIFGAHKSVAETPVVTVNGGASAGGTSRPLITTQFAHTAPLAYDGFRILTGSATGISFDWELLGIA